VSKTWSLHEIPIAIDTLLRYNCAEHEARAEPKASLSRTIERVSLLLYHVNGFKSKIFVQEYKRSPIPLDELHCNEI
jgi:hypothetical protein